MKTCVPICLLLGLFCGAWAQADLVLARRRESEQKVSAWGLRSFVDTFQGNKRAAALASGWGQATCLGLYVYDEYGNCVARDDITTPKTGVDLAADWVPAATARYDVEIRNAGYMPIEFDIALR